MAKSKKKASKKVAVKTIDKSLGSFDWLKNTRRLGIVLFALSILLYVNTFGHEYAQDDAIVITDNMFTTEGISGIPGLFSKDTFFGFFKVEGKAKLVSGGRYRPLTPAMFALEYELFGDSPMVMHMFNALWYGLTVLVLYWVFLALFQAKAAAQKQLPALVVFGIPFVTALLFATHPLHTEAVANIKGRDEIITLLGSLGALLCILKSRTERPALWLGLGALSFFLGLLAKENAITYLGVIPLALYFFTKDSIPSIAKQTAPLLLAAVVFLLIRGSILGWDLGEPSRELMNNPFLKIENNQWVDFAAGEKSATIMYTLGKYAQLLLAPYPLVHDYYPRAVAIENWSSIRVLLSLLLYLGLVVMAIRGLAKKDLTSFAILAYLLPLSIVSNIVFPVGTNMSERFLFMPSVGFALLAAYLLHKYLSKAQTFLGVGLGIALVFSAMTILRNPAWKNNYTLFTTDIHNAPNSAKLRNAMAGELSVQWAALPEARRDSRKDMLREAVGHIDAAVKIHPTYKQAYYIKGNVLNYLQEYDASIQAYQQALQIDPDYALAQNNIYLTYRDAGRFFGEKQGDIPRAIRYLEQAYQGNPTDYETVRLLGVASGISGNTSRAIELFEKNTTLQPDNARAWWDLGTAYYNAGQAAPAEQAIAKARSIDPNIETKVQSGQ